MDKETIIQSLFTRDPRGRGSFGFFIATAKNTPTLQKLIDEIETLSEEEISNLPQRKWVKKHLLNLHHEMTVRPPGALSPEQIANIMIEKSQ